MASLLGSLAGGLGKGIGQMAQVREENNRRKQDKQFQVNMDERRAKREEALAKWRFEQQREAAQTEREWRESQSEKDRDLNRELSGVKAEGRAAERNAEKVEKIFSRLDEEYQNKRGEIFEYAPKDPVTGQPQITEAVQQELTRLDQIYQTQKQTMVEQYGENLIGTSYEPYYLNQRSQAQKQGLLQANMDNVPGPTNGDNFQSNAASKTSKPGDRTEDMAASLRTKVSTTPAGSASRLRGASAEAVKPPPMPWVDYEKESNINQKYRGY